VSAYTIAVRTLCEFAAREGDLDMRFTPSPSSEQGMAGHRIALARRSPAYRREVAVSGTHAGLEVRGRADGFDPQRMRVEEVKTCIGDAQRVPPNQRGLHWAQAKVYAALLCRELGAPRMTVALVYFDVRNQHELPALVEEYSAQALDAFFVQLCERFRAWAALETAHRAARDAALERLAFPHPRFRTGQRDLAKAVFRAARDGACLLAQAPTGSGKTVATLFPMLKACPTHRLDKIFYLTAKSSGRVLALSALDTLRRTGCEIPLRILDLTAREKSCEHPDKRCHPDSCPLARGFYDRLPAARVAALSESTLTKSAVREVALAHGVCPYYLGQEMARWCDVVVADYNHYFDASALLHGLMQANGWRVGVLVDEAHNLLERGRAMYSASLDSADLRAIRRRAPASVRPALERLQRSWRRLAGPDPDSYRVLAEAPAAWRTALQKAAAAIAEHLAEAPASIDEPLLRFHFAALGMERLLAELDAHSLIDLARAADSAAAGRARREGWPGSADGAKSIPPQRSRVPDSVLSVRNVVPAHFLRARFADAHAAVLFSATLAPWNFYVDCLGLPPDSARIDVPPVFGAHQLQVRIARHLSTRYRDRACTAAPIADLVAAEFEREPGNYLVYSSSHVHLAQLAQAFAQRHPHIAAWRQEPAMREGEREAFLQRFAPGGRGIGFAVLGGTFGEGIDLGGTRLIGVFVATLGLPQWNPVNEEMRRRFDRLYGRGYAYTYLFPGLRKVVQAAGRVLRSEADRGSVHLIDDRFARAEVLRLLPRWWQIETLPARRQPP